MSQRTKMVVANWKMHLSYQEAESLLRDISKFLLGQDSWETQVVVCPAYVYLELAQRKLTRSQQVWLGAQDVSQKDFGPFTGMVSVGMLENLVDFVIVGHSERRKWQLENDDLIAQKLEKVCLAGLTGILCVGEDEEQRSKGLSKEIVSRQLEKALPDSSALKKSGGAVVVAYEPVWAIGSGQAAKLEVVEEMASYIRDILGGWSKQLEPQTRLLYGGSTNSDNVDSFVTSPSIDGVLVGGASLDCQKFCSMIEIVERL